MRNVLFAAAAAATLALTATGALAQAAKVPTGYQVEGCARYELTVDNRVKQICDDLEINQLRKDMANRVGRFEPKGDSGDNTGDSK